MRFRQHGHAVHQRVVRRRTGTRLVAGLDQRLVDGGGKLADQALRRAALRMVDDKLQHAVARQGQHDLASIAQGMPRRPISQGTLVTHARVA
ncbi:hypothetical protein D3C71_1720750 [compost metagenome]